MNVEKLQALTGDVDADEFKAILALAAIIEAMHDPQHVASLAEMFATFYTSKRRGDLDAAVAIETLMVFAALVKLGSLESMDSVRAEAAKRAADDALKAAAQH